MYLYVSNISHECLTFNAYCLSISPIYLITSSHRPVRSVSVISVGILDPPAVHQSLFLLSYVLKTALPDPLEMHRFDDHGAPQIQYRLHFAEKANFIGDFIAAILLAVCKRMHLEIFAHRVRPT